MEEAERIAREEHGSVKLAVISGACAPAAVLAWMLTIDALLQAWARATTTAGWGTSSTGRI